MKSQSPQRTGRTLGMKLRCVPSFLGLAFLFLSFLCAAAEASELEWRGFFTTGTAFTDSKTNYQSGITQKARVAEETFLGLNLSKELNSEWRVAGQILARSASDSAAKVDWAFVTYEPDSNYSVTLGKQKIPMWMISAYLDVGRAYPWVVPPEEVYAIFNLKAFTGASASYALNLGASVLTFRPYGGDAIVETTPSSPDPESKLRATNMFGASIEWTLNKSMIRAAYNRALWDLDLGPDLMIGERRYEIGTLGVKTEGAGFWFMAEFVATRDTDEDRYQGLAGELEEKSAIAAASGDTASAAAFATQASNFRLKLGGSHAYYATLGRQIESFFLHLTYAAVDRPFNSRLSRDQSSFALGLNYDVNVDSVIKLEAKRVFVPSGSQGLFAAKPEKDEAMVYRLGYSMIF